MHEKLNTTELTYRFSDLHKLIKEYPLMNKDDYQDMLKLIVSGHKKKVWVREWTEQVILSILSNCRIYFNLLYMTNKSYFSKSDLKELGIGIMSAI